MNITTRTKLSDDSWIDISTGWLRNADSLMQPLFDELAFKQECSARGPQPRLTAVCGRSMSPKSGYTKPNPDSLWTPTAARVRDLVLDAVSDRCPDWRPTGLIANYYRSGADSIDWHADDEPALGEAPVVVSVSFGATRTFLVRANEREPGTTSSRFKLSSGSLVVMGGRMQEEFQHSIGKVVAPGARLSLTFRDYPAA